MLKGFISLFFYYQWEESLACQSNWFLRRQEGLFWCAQKGILPPAHPPTPRRWIPRLYESGEAVTQDGGMNRCSSQWQTWSMQVFFHVGDSITQTSRTLHSMKPHVACVTVYRQEVFLIWRNSEKKNGNRRLFGCSAPPNMPSLVLTPREVDI